MAEHDIQRILENIENLAPEGDLRVDEVRPPDIAEAMSDMDESAKVLIISLLSDEKAAEVLTQADEHTVETLVQRLSVDRLVRLIDEMDPDDAADIIALAPEALRQGLIDSLDENQRRSVRALHEHEPESAGGIMTTEAVAAGSNEKVRSAVAKVREAEQPEVIGSVYVVDPAGTLVGFVDLQDLLQADPEATVGSIMSTDVISVPLDADQEEAARLVDRYDLAALPVVDVAGRLKGVITLDDVIDVLAEEASEDMLLVAGTSATHPTTEPILRRLRARAPWLGVTLAGTFVAGLLIETVQRRWFGGGQEPLSTFNALLYFIPLIGGMAGNIGSQSSTIMVRGFATGEVDPQRPLRVLKGEVVLGLLIGVIAGLLVGIGVGIFFATVPGLGYMVGIALLCSTITAALAGTLIPFACHALHVDPAYAAGPFLLTLNDLAAFSIYFAVALGLQDVFGF